MNDDLKRPGIATVPPPPGEEDLYSASTVVGQASDELLAIVRAAEEKESNLAKAASKPAGAESKAVESDEAKLLAMKEAAARAAKQAAANEVAREATKTASVPPAAKVITAAPPRPTPAPGAGSPAPATSPAVASPATSSPATSSPTTDAPTTDAPVAPPRAPMRRANEDETSKRRAVKLPAKEAQPSGGLPPIVSIVVMFAAAALALAALVR